MNFDLNTEQKMLKDSARNFFSREAGTDFIREMENDEKGYSSKMWKKMARLGWMGLLIPEEYNGEDMGFLDMSVLLEEMGYACLPGPFFSTAVLSVITLIECANDRQKKNLLPKIADGSQLLTLAWIEESGTYSGNGITAKAELKDDNYIISGTKLFVPDANSADKIIVAARTDNSSSNPDEGISLFVVDTKGDSRNENIKIEVLKTIRSDKLCEVTFKNTIVSKENMLGEPGKGWEILKKVLLKAAVAKCAEMSGGAKRVLEIVVDYAKIRHQFGRPIGSFQAIQHHCADILTFVDTSVFMTNMASWKINEGLPYEKQASMVKSWVSESYKKLVSLGHQVLGGVGFMEEFDLQLYYKQAKACELAYGDADFHRELVAVEMGL
ncbi:MAG: acyl-CoA/acyl-ACP dehydrogenase [Desulfobacterales bacterium]|nr:acyl-CoA/acyl-ACP dehydrogenase [Desulfobacteraceae bacterium]MBT4363925.1 acyl-CoA/acyl-ACP dehydrogenase [Desulfobacteraceae bacterium]MBT7087170.1 acyl-CoA/acyl-ACP dehydrogenase [Desulfobacterales bacterium]MBT7695903.1 acyl-CoA/acyl-ACP dehydrogenase [Desulfobacterales bacterium]